MTFLIEFLGSYQGFCLTSLRLPSPFDEPALLEYLPTGCLQIEACRYPKANSAPENGKPSCLEALSRSSWPKHSKFEVGVPSPKIAETH